MEAVWVDEGRERVSRGRYSAPALPGGFAHRPGSAGSTPVFCLAHIVKPAPISKIGHRMDLR